MNPNFILSFSEFHLQRKHPECKLYDPAIIHKFLWTFILPHCGEGIGE